MWLVLQGKHPTDKRVHIALTYIHGIGNTKGVTTALGIGEMSRVNSSAIGWLRSVKRSMPTTSLVTRLVRMNIKRLQDMKCYAVYAIVLAGSRTACVAPGPARQGRRNRR